jgi:hypothetical protein
MAQQGQVLRLRTRRGDGKTLWAYRYRVNGRCSKRPQVGGFATRADAERALRRELGRLRPGATLTLAELVEEYLRVHQAAPSTIEKLRWLLSKATAAFGDVALGGLRAEEICAWRATLPEGHRFEATQALRQVLNAAVAWELIDVNPARRGVANPLRRFPEKRPFESWEQINALAARLDAVTGPMLYSAPRPGCGRRSSSPSSNATSTAPAASSTTAGSSSAAGSSRPRHGGASAPCRCSRPRVGSQNSVQPAIRGLRNADRRFRPARAHWSQIA